MRGSSACWVREFCFARPFVGFVSFFWGSLVLLVCRYVDLVGSSVCWFRHFLGGSLVLLACWYVGLLYCWVRRYMGSVGLLGAPVRWVRRFVGFVLLSGSSVFWGLSILLTCWCIDLLSSFICWVRWLGCWIRLLVGQIGVGRFVDSSAGLFVWVRC